ncbi:hypothetical protein V1264_018581 [Littorina saxatilis]
MKLTQSWPPAVCIYLQNEKKKCDISSNITSWVIHGLWPTQTGTECPNFCRDDWKFNLTQVQALRPRLDFNWPSIDFDGKPEYSWTHEWEKHGTCGATLPAIKDELDYFNVTLGLHEHFNLSLILQKSGMNPSAKNAYKAKDFMTAFKKGLGVAPSVTCVKDKEDEKFYIEQVEICLNKDFKPIDCQSYQSAPVEDLLFKPESWLQGGRVDEGVLRDVLIDCGSDSDVVYYKPMPSKQRKVLA